METYAAIMTKQGAGAISTIQLFGGNSGRVLQQIFTPSPDKFETGKILIGEIRDKSDTIDRVTIGCESEDCFAIHSHGNPLICEMIMNLLSENGVKLLDAGSLRAKIESSQNYPDTIALEARLEYPRTPTLFAAKLLLEQSGAGLAESARKILENLSELSPEQIHKRIKQILTNTEISKNLTRPCDIVIAGPANSGKSTLLNNLTGSEKALVTPHKGTTRDWITSTIKTSNMVLNLTDTAGLDKTLTDAPDTKAQENALSLLDDAALILLVLDVNRRAVSLSRKFLNLLEDKRVITVLNKTDLPEKLNTQNLPSFLQNFVRISAENQTGFDKLVKQIKRTLKTDTIEIEPESPVCFTSRQERLCRKILNSNDKNRIHSLITELLTGKK